MLPYKFEYTLPYEKEVFNQQKKRGNIMSYNRNGYGERINNPKAYYKAVAEDRYGYSSYNHNSSNSYTSGWNDGYSSGYADGYSDGSESW